MFFSVPFFFKDEYIDFIVNLNNQDTKYKIKRAYNSLTYWSSEDYSGFEYFKSVNNTDSRLNKSTFNDLEKYVSRLQKENIEFIYAMNIATPFSSEKFESMIPRLNNFITRLQSIGVNHISVASQMLVDHINSNFPDMNIGISTMMHVDSIGKAKYLKELFNNIEYLIPCVDINKDFDFIRAFKTLLPDVNLELMANEGCLFCCPTKNLHYTIFGMKRDDVTHNGGKAFIFPNSICGKITNNTTFLQVMLSKSIFPWEVSDYEKFGVDSLKLVGRDNAYDLTTKQIETYMIGSTNPDKILNKYLLDVVPFISTMACKSASHTLINYLTLSYFKKYAPSDEFFIKSRPNCRTSCQATCNYCYKLADDLEMEAKQL